MVIGAASPALYTDAQFHSPHLTLRCQQVCRYSSFPHEFDVGEGSREDGETNTCDPSSQAPRMYKPEAPYRAIAMILSHMGGKI